MEKVILITGASSGIGLHTAKYFQAKNWKVAATMRSPGNSDLQKIADIECFRLDVTDRSTIRQAFDGALEKFGRIDVVVNNAGYGLLGPFEASTEEQVRRQFDTNVFGLMNVCREIIPYFREQKGGFIVNISSVSGRMAFPFMSLYHASKWAVEGFSESLRYELEPFNIKVKLIEPGPIRTEFYGRSQDIAKGDGFAPYSVWADKAISFMNKAGRSAPDGEIVAEAIYRSVTDGTNRLRYGVNTKGLLVLRRLMPEVIFRGLIRRLVLK
jgi:NAD(P)-dependent dehydrogenase (short-subunit alcohol dehydrogenase family)